MGPAKKKWSIWRHLLIWPLLSALALDALMLWVVIDETQHTRMLDGRPDDAPRMAALFIGFAITVAYLGYATIVALIRAAIRAKPPYP